MAEPSTPPLTIADVTKILSNLESKRTRQQHAADTTQLEIDHWRTVAKELEGRK